MAIPELDLHNADRAPGAAIAGDPRPADADKGFCGYSEPRPRQLTPELALQAAKKIVERLLESNLLDKSEADESARNIAKEGRGRYIDGYALAKALEDYHHWAPNFEVAEILNEYRDHASDEISAAEKEWAERVKPEPPFPVGTHIRISQTETGKITEIYKYGTAKYCVKIDGDAKAGPPTNSRRIINFEDARAA